MQVNGSVSGAFQAGATGVQRGQDQVEQAAQSIASRESSRPPEEANESRRGAEETRQAERSQQEQSQREEPVQAETRSEPPPNEASDRSVEEDIVQLREGERQAEASAKVLETADEALGSIIDVRA